MKRLIWLFITCLIVSITSPASAQQLNEERNWRDESIYFIMIDRFHNGDRSNDYNVNTEDPYAYQGGDFQGIIDQLDYIQEMGFTAIWLTPIMKNVDGGYHGYWVEDFYDTEEHFGTIDKFKELVNEAHARGIKVIVDFVVNHVGPNHPWLDDPEKKDWFHEEKEIINWNNQEEIEQGWIFGLPDLAQEKEEVRDYLIDVAKWWIEETDIDGYRLDTVKHVPIEFWKEFSKEVKAVKDDFFLLGEVWSNDPSYIGQYEQAGIDGFVDYPLNKPLRNVFAKPDVPLTSIFDQLAQNEQYYEEPYLMGAFLDNHDLPRFTRDIVLEKQYPGTRWKLALTYLFTGPEIPIVYYGSEIALDGGEDPDNRRFMSFRADKELIDYVSILGQIRQNFPALTRGTFEVLFDGNGMAVYKREYDGQTVVVAINNSSQSKSVTLTAEQLENNKELRGVILEDLVRSKDGEYTIILDRETAEVYVLEDKTGINYPFIITLASVYILFIIFIIIVTKRRKRKTS